MSPNVSSAPSHAPVHAARRDVLREAAPELAPPRFARGAFKDASTKAAAAVADCSTGASLLFRSAHCSSVHKLGFCKAP
eukprot:CAMPEP_0115553598 /NCGR_PEP_ID=MMETSP0271-20121206/96858_1 /TAXON_ID=71861 /ORGANISM="Scrippsiella trochoidea, Strain CCMP3099" /LENGTH=78 /DNA_ID=CAMNT_0002987293 /DNA_START=286 /DNA_END=523 /DNA_ORIENTATION=-